MTKLMAFCKGVWQRIDWRPNVLTCLEIALILLIYPLMQWANPQYFVEDGWVENIQLLVLLAAIIIALRTKLNRPLFVFAALVIVLMIMRETNLFRGYFCAVYLQPGVLCRWEEFSYGYLVKGIRWVFVAYALYYFVRHKIWQPIMKYVLNAPIFVWDILICGLMIIGGMIAEMACVDNEVMEECCEWVCYLALTNCVYRYSRLSL